MVHLNLDQATKKFGLAIYDDEKLIVYKDFNLIKLLNKPNTDEQINVVKKIMLKYIEDYNVEIVVFENIFLNNYKGNYSNYTAFLALAKLLGVLQDAIYEKKMLSCLVNASTWRSTCKIRGTGGIQKKNAIKFVKDTFDLSVGEDLAEAICIGYHTSKKIIPKIKSSKI